MKARRIFHAYRLKSTPSRHFESDDGLNLLSARLCQYAEYFEDHLLEDHDCKNRLMEAILSVPDRKLAVSLEVYEELLDLFKAKKIHAGIPKEKEEK